MKFDRGPSCREIRRLPYLQDPLGDWEGTNRFFHKLKTFLTITRKLESCGGDLLSIDHRDTTLRVKDTTLQKFFTKNHSDRLRQIVEVPWLNYVVPSFRGAVGATGKKTRNIVLCPSN